MKTYFSLAVLAIAMLFSCKTFENNESAGPKDAAQDSVADSTTVRVLKEYFSNGKVKTETTAKGNLRHGLTKNYDREGHLISQVNYVNNIRDGMATNFYAVSGKVNSTLVYKDGIKEGDEIWYYESGKPYRVTPYIKGFANGIQKYYYEDGRLKAELPMKNGKPGVGLKEYQYNGTLITNYPSLIIRQRDYISQANKVILTIELSEPSQVKFYRGSLDEGKYLTDKLLELAVQNGISQVDFNVAPGSTINQKVVISANVKTPFGNQLILSKTFLVNATSNY